MLEKHSLQGAASIILDTRTGELRRIPLAPIPAGRDQDPAWIARADANYAKIAQGSISIVRAGSQAPNVPSK